MTQPITPARLALCAAVRLYLDSEENEVANEDTARLGPLLLRVLQFEDATGDGSGSGLDRDATLVDVLALLQRGTRNGDDAQEMQAAGNEDGVWLEAVPAAVLGRVRRLDSPDALIDFFTDIAASLTSAAGAPPGSGPEGAEVEVHSALGTALRRTLLAFDALPFEGVCALFGAIQDELDAVSAEALQEALEQPPAQQDGTRPPGGSGKQEGEQLGGAQPGVQAASQKDAEDAAARRRRHFRRHAKALRERDLLAALDSLHQHFDYNTGGARGDEPGQGEWAGTFQNALLSLAASHAHFGHTTQALTALNETVRVSQQAGDAACLAHALAALCGLLANTPPVPPPLAGAPPPPPHLRHDNHLRRLLRVCIRQGAEVGLPHLTAFARLGLAKAALQGGTTPPPAIWRDPAQHQPAAPAPSLEVAAALDAVQQLHHAAATSAAAPSPAQPPVLDPAAAAAARAADLFGSGTAVFGPALQGCEAAAAAAVEELAGGSHLLMGAAWSAAGAPDLAAAAAVTRIACFSGPHRQSEDLDGGGPVEATESSNAEADSAQQAADVALAYAQLAMLAHERRGPRAAEAVLARADAALPGCDATALAAARLTVGHGLALARGEMEKASTARDLASQLAAVAATAAGADIELQAAADTVRVRQAIGERRFKEAAAAANDMFAVCHAAMLQAGCVEALLLSAEAHRAALLPASALPHALAALHHARRLSLDLLSARAVIALADIWLALGPQHAQRAAAEVRSVLPLISAQGGLRLRAEAHAVLARAQLTDVTAQDLNNGAADWPIALLVEASSCYEALEDYESAAEQRHLAAVAADAAGLQQRRNKEAAAWARLLRAADDDVETAPT